MGPLCDEVSHLVLLGSQSAHCPCGCFCFTAKCDIYLATSAVHFAPTTQGHSTAFDHALHPVVDPYEGMAINPLKENYMPIIRIPFLGWMTINHILCFDPGPSTYDSNICKWLILWFHCLYVDPALAALAVSAKDMTSRSVTEKLLTRPRTLQRIKDSGLGAMWLKPCGCVGFSVAV
jgi:hypothetical protein